jgi:hypothetical protein
MLKRTTYEKFPAWNASLAFLCCLSSSYFSLLVRLGLAHVHHKQKYHLPVRGNHKQEPLLLRVCVMESRLYETLYRVRGENRLIFGLWFWSL